MIKTHRALVITALLLGVVVGTPTRAESFAPVSLSYRLWAGGLHALSFETYLAEKQETYQVRLTARTDGLVGWLYPYGLEANALGTAGSGGVRPEKFRSSNRDRGEEEGLVIDYQADGAPRVHEVPPDDSPPDDMPERLTRGSIDPVSGVFSIIRTIARNGRCSGTTHVFDGKRRYDMVAHDLGADDLPASNYAVYSGPAIKCRVRIDRLAGFKDEMAGRYPSEIDVWLAPVIEGGSPVPVRLEAENSWGGLRAYLVAVDVDTAAGESIP